MATLPGIGTARSSGSVRAGATGAAPDEGTKLDAIREHEDPDPEPGGHRLDATLLQLARQIAGGIAALTRTAVAVEARDRQRAHDGDDREDDHQLDQGKAGRAAGPRAGAGGNVHYICHLGRSSANLNSRT
jgi:hypothetical protein